VDNHDELPPTRLWAGSMFATFRRSQMRQYAVIALVGLLLVMTQSMLRAQDSKAEKKRTIAEIKRLGGQLEVDTNNPDLPVIGVNLKHTKEVDASLEHVKGLTELQKVYLRDTNVSDDGMVYIKGLTNLEVLELGRTKVTDKGLSFLKGFTKLQRLDLGGTQVTDKGLEQLKGLTSLQTLSLEDAVGVSDLGLVHLKGLTNLRKLNLGGTKVTDAGVQDLQRVLPKVKIMH
jgi:internalin A